MIFKVLYQPDQTHTPRREATRTLYLEAKSAIEARDLIEKHTKYNVESIQQLTGNYLKYEQQSPNYKLVTFK